MIDLSSCTAADCPQCAGRQVEPGDPGSARDWRDYFRSLGQDD